MLVSVDDDLGVAAALELVAPFHQLFAQLSKIVDFAVMDEVNDAFRIAHRLVGRRAQVDDREPRMAQPDMRVAPDEKTVGAAMTQGRDHAADIVAQRLARHDRRG